MTALEAYEAFDAKWPKSLAWFDFDYAPKYVSLDGDFTLDQLREIVRLAEGVSHEG